MLQTQRGPKRGRGRARASAQRFTNQTGRSASSTPNQNNRPNGLASPKPQGAKGAVRGSTSRGNRGLSNRGHGRGAFKTPASATPKQQQQPQPSTFTTVGKGDWQQRYQLLRTHRDKERQEAIQNGFLADPDQPRRLEDAITPVGTCQDMCAEFERVQRVVQMDVWGSEKTPDKSSPDESRMVKKFRRAAAGVDEQLPSDLRPPPVLKRTLDFLLHDVVYNADSLADVHHFVWDRTRAIRNDFSIQQISKGEDLLITIECFERIARFHILSLHHFAGVARPYDQYTAQQEREQLDKTLLSLMQYFDDSRGKLQSPNEPEFRAYSIIFQIQSPMPNLPAKMHSWPGWIVTNPLVRTAMKLYDAACNTFDPQGPLQPSTEHLVAQENWREFWRLIESDEVTYLMACVAEIYFPMLRQTVVRNIWTGCRKGGAIRKNDDWSLDDLTYALEMDHEDGVQELMEQYGFTITEHEDGTAFADLGSVQRLPDIVVKATASHTVERKRKHRFFPAVVDGMSVLVAQAEGNVSADESDDDMAADEDDDSLFVSDSSEQRPSNFSPFAAQSTATSPFSTNAQGSTSVASNPFASAPSQGSINANNTSSSSNPFAFGTTPLKVDSETQQGENGKDHTWKQGSPITFGTGSFTSNFVGEKQSVKSSFLSFGQPSNSSTSSSSPLPVSQPVSDSKSSTDVKNGDVNNDSGKSSAVQPAETSSTDPTKPKSPFASQMYRPKHSSPLSQVSFTPLETTTLDDSSQASKPSFPHQFMPAPAQMGTTFEKQPQKKDVSQPILDSSEPENPFAPSENLQGSSSAFAQDPLSNPFANPFAVAAPQEPANKLNDLDSGNRIFSQDSITKKSSSALGQASNSTFNSISSTSSAPAKPLSKAQDVLSQPTPAKAQGDPYEHLTRILLLQEHGIFEQIIQRMTDSMFEDVQRAVMDEKYREEADQFRIRSLSRRYGTRWRLLWWTRRMSRLGAERRRRQRLAHDEKEKRKQEASVTRQYEDFLRSRSQSQSQSQAPAQTNNRMHRNAKSLNQISPSADSFGASLLTNNPMGSTQIGQDPSNHIRQPVGSAPYRLSSNYDKEQLRGSFRPGPAPPDRIVFPNGPTPQNKTQSVYWELRSRGYDPNSRTLFSDTAGTDRKRPRDDETDDIEASPRKRSPTDQDVSRPLSTIARAHPSVEGSPGTSRRPIVSKGDELLDELRRVREQLAEGAAWFKNQHTRLSGSPSPSSSPDLSAAGSVSKYRQLYGGVLEENRSFSRRGSPLRPASSHAGTSSRGHRVSKFSTREQYASILNGQRKDIGKSNTSASKHTAPLSQPRQSWLDKMNARTEAAKRQILKDAEEEHKRISEFYSQPQQAFTANSSVPTLPKAKDEERAPLSEPAPIFKPFTNTSVSAPNGTNTEAKPSLFGFKTGANSGLTNQPLFGSKPVFGQSLSTAAFSPSNSAQSIVERVSKNPFSVTQGATFKTGADDGSSMIIPSPDRRPSPPPLKRSFGSQPSPTPKRNFRPQNNMNKFAGLEVEGGTDDDDDDDADGTDDASDTGGPEPEDTAYDADSNEDEGEVDVESAADGDEEMAEEEEEGSEEEDDDDDEEEAQPSNGIAAPRRFAFDMNAGTSEADAITLDSD